MATSQPTNKFNDQLPTWLATITSREILNKERYLTEKRLSFLEVTTEFLCSQHKLAEAHYNCLHMLMFYPIVLFGAAITVLSFLNEGKSAETPGFSIAAGVMGALVTVLQSIEKNRKFAERADYHRNTSQLLTAVSRDVKLARSTLCGGTANVIAEVAKADILALLKVVDETKATFAKVQGSSPYTIPPQIALCFSLLHDQLELHEWDPGHSMNFNKIWRNTSYDKRKGAPPAGMSKDDLVSSILTEKHSWEVYIKSRLWLRACDQMQATVSKQSFWPFLLPSTICGFGKDPLKMLDTVVRQLDGLEFVQSAFNNGISFTAGAAAEKAATARKAATRMSTA